MTKPKTRLKWKRAQGDSFCDYEAFLRIDRYQAFQFVIELTQTKPNRVEVRRAIWLNESDPLFEDVKMHDTSIEWFQKELGGLEWNMLCELSAYLRRALDKVDELMYERDTTHS